MAAESPIRLNFGDQMIQFDRFLGQPQFAQHRLHFESAISKRHPPGRHGDLPTWIEILNALPNAGASFVELDRDAIIVGRAEDITVQQEEAIRLGLLALSPWRKGPYEIFGIHIDTEWRSDWKWNRVQPHISSLRDRMVLDVGCGTGYHCWRMLGDGAQYVLGIDPSMRFVVQNAAVQKYAGDSRFDFAPLGIEDMPSDLPIFDSVFSMGVLYHRRHPINHLLELKGLMPDGGELILETLIYDQHELSSAPMGADLEADTGVLRPESRYAQMRNVWSIMTVEKILNLLAEAGFQDAFCADQNVTSLEEQRRTEWMQYHSLEDFLDPQARSLTIEGYPAPKRGLFIARK